MTDLPIWLLKVAKKYLEVDSTGLIGYTRHLNGIIHTVESFIHYFLGFEPVSELRLPLDDHHQSTGLIARRGGSLNSMAE